MKKRILSFVLAAMMVVMVFAVPTAVAGAVSNNYSYKFADTDIRNIVDGQVFDVAAKGEAEDIPTVNGAIEEGEYTASGVLKARTNAKNANAELPVHFAVRNGYLYVGFTYENELEKAAIQYDIGVLQDHRSDGAWSRKQVTWKANDTLGNHSYLLKVPGTNTWSGGSCETDSNFFIVDKYYHYDRNTRTGTYEAKFDISAYYELFENSCRGIGIYDTPCMTIAIWYDVDEKAAVGQTHYAFPVSATKIDSAVSTDWVPATIIIPEKTLKAVAEKNIGIGERGTDLRNMVDTQLVSLKEYVEEIPVLDGKVSADEYTIQNHLHKTAPVEITASYAIAEDGYLYVAFSYKDANHGKIIVQPGIGNDNGCANISRLGYTLKPDATVAYQNALMRHSAAMNSTSSTYNTWSSGGWAKIDSSVNKGLSAIESCATTHDAGITTYEFKMKLASLVEFYKLGAHDPEYANAVHFLLFVGNSTTQTMFNITTAQKDAIRKSTGVDYCANYVHPVVELPAGTTASVHNHKSDKVTVIKEATHYADGLIKFDCDICGEKNVEELVPRTLKHEFEDAVEHNELNHKVACKCGYAEYVEHKWDKGTLAAGPIADGRQKMIYKCTECSAIKEEILPVDAPAITEAPTTAAPTTEAPTTEAPTTEVPTTVAPTTEAPTTAAPTTVAPATAAPTTEAPEESGCGSVVALSALALVPMLGMAVVFGKKRED